MMIQTIEPRTTSDGDDGDEDAFHPDSIWNFYKCSFRELEQKSK